MGVDDSLECCWSPFLGQVRVGFAVLGGRSAGAPLGCAAETTQEIEHANLRAKAEPSSKASILQSGAA
jgi:hypothetical protein